MRKAIEALASFLEERVPMRGGAHTVACGFRSADSVGPATSRCTAQLKMHASVIPLSDAHSRAASVQPIRWLAVAAFDSFPDAAGVESTRATALGIGPACAEALTSFVDGNACPAGLAIP
jgi:hypothetical protein